MTTTKLFTLFITLVIDPYINLSLFIIKATYFHQILTEEVKVCSKFYTLHSANLKNFQACKIHLRSFFMQSLFSLKVLYDNSLSLWRPSGSGPAGGVLQPENRS